MGKSDRIQRKHDEEREKLAAKLEQEEKQNRKSRRARNSVIGVLALVLILAIAWGVLSGYGLLQGIVTAVRIGDQNITAAEYNYYYLTTIQNFQNQYGDYLSYMGLDFTKPLSTQQYTEDMTWEQYFSEQAMNSLKSVVVMSEEAKKNNIALTEGDKLQIDAFFNTISESSDNLDKVLPNVFGKGTTVENLRATRERYQLAQRYILNKLASFEVSDEEIEQRYNENRKDYDKVDYNYFSFPVDSEGLDEDQTKVLKEQTLAKANEMTGRVSNGEDFAALAREYAPEDQKETYEAENATLSLGTLYSSISSDADLADWLFDEARKPGDVQAIETASGYTVALFNSRYRDEYNTRSVRHILIPPKVGEDGIASDEEQVEAHDKAEQILEEFKAGGSSLDKFSTLCATYSDDTATAADGGLYEYVHKGEMVPEFEAWLYDEARKPGDTDIVKTDYGYHIMYYVGESLPSWKATVKDDIINEEFSAEFDTVEATYAVAEKSLGMSITK